jgi:tetratricopeptide (TPR) repeat protein
MTTLTAEVRPGRHNADESWDRFMECGRQQYATGNLQAAEGCYESASKVASHLKDDERRGIALSELSVVLLKGGYSSKASAVANKAAAFFESCGSEKCGADLAQGRCNLALVYMQQNRLPEAKALLLKALDWHNDTQSDLKPVAVILHALGWLELHRRSPAKAEPYFRTAIIKIQEDPSADQLRSALYGGLSAALSARNKKPEAVIAAHKAFDLALFLDGADPRIVIDRASMLVAISTGVRDFATAERSLDHGLEVASHQPAYESFELGVLLKEAGKLRFAQGRFAEALQWTGKARDILGRHVLSDDPIVISARATYAGALQKMGRKQEADAMTRQIRAATQHTPGYLVRQHTVDISELDRRK